MKVSIAMLMLSFLLLVSVVVNFYLASQLVMTRNEISRLSKALSENTVVSSLVINFGNGTRVWYNNTMLPFGASLLNLTIKATNNKVTYTIGKYGAFVSGIYDVGTKYSKPSYYWIWYKWNATAKQWEMGSVSADGYKVLNGEVLGWVYANTSSWPNLAKP